jgi:hypothetical protein
MAVAPPTVPKAEELYNSLMREIEPDLTTDQIPLIDEKYKGETPEETLARLEKYKKAFALYDEKSVEFFKDLSNKVTAYRKQALQEAETEVKGEEQVRISQIETLLSHP